MIQLDPERFYTLVSSDVVKNKVECGDSFRISPDGKTAIVNIKRKQDITEHENRLKAVSIDGKILTVEEARAIVNKWDK